MGQEVSNRGQTGLGSIRIGGMKPEDLPLRESALTQEQMPAIKEADRKNQVENVRAKYPTQSVAWINGAIREAEETIKNVRGLVVQQNTMINEYSAHIGLCAHRDTELAALGNMLKTGGIVQSYHDERAKALKLEFPPYNVKAMKTQIQLCKEAILRSDMVIDTEHKSISDLRELMQKCIQRDALLKSLGETVD